MDDQTPDKLSFPDSPPPQVQDEETPVVNIDQEDKLLDNNDSDDESILSEIDEAQFEDFDPSAIAVEDRPVALDESNVGQLKAHKRKRTDDADADDKRKKRKDRERAKKSRKHTNDDEDDDNFSGGDQLEGKRIRKSKDASNKKDRPRPRARSPENEDLLTPEERRRRALDRAMDDALKAPNRRRKRLGGIDLEAQNDDLIENTRRRMADAAKLDGEARRVGKPAMQKLKMLPEVVALLNRNTLRDQLVDPDLNLLEAVRFFLEPLDDGSLPAYNIQRELFAALAKLPINKDALVASGIGKVTLFYLKSAKPEAAIRRQAERLIGEWSRPILNRSDDYRKRQFVEVAYDPTALPIRTNLVKNALDPAAAARARQLATPVLSNRARPQTGSTGYSIVPRSTLPVGGKSGRSRR